MAEPEERYRLFVGLEFADSIRAELGSVIERLKGDSRFAKLPVRWTPAENLHLTLNFLGSVPISEVEPLSAALERCAASLPALSIRLGACGGFPERGKVRVIWAAVNGGEKLGSLQRSVCGTCEGLNFPIEKRPFVPHATLARIRHGGPVVLRSCLEALSVTPCEERIENVALFRSYTRSDGVRYEVIERFTLGSG